VRFTASFIMASTASSSSSASCEWNSSNSPSRKQSRTIFFAKRFRTTSLRCISCKEVMSILGCTTIVHLVRVMWNQLAMVSKTCLSLKTYNNTHPIPPIIPCNPDKYRRMKYRFSGESVLLSNSESGNKRCKKRSNLLLKILKTPTVIAITPTIRNMIILLLFTIGWCR
jgi:hypothetical protein